MSIWSVWKVVHSRTEDVIRLYWARADAVRYADKLAEEQLAYLKQVPHDNPIKVYPREIRADDGSLWIYRHTVDRVSFEVRPLEVHGSPLKALASAADDDTSQD